MESFKLVPLILCCCRHEYVIVSTVSAVTGGQLKNPIADSYPHPLTLTMTPVTRPDPSSGKTRRGDLNIRREDEAQPMPPGVFHYFPRLPAELRIATWEMALDPRGIRAVHYFTLFKTRGLRATGLSMRGTRASETRTGPDSVPCQPCRCVLTWKEALSMIQYVKCIERGARVSHDPPESPVRRDAGDWKPGC